MEELKQDLPLGIGDSPLHDFTDDLSLLRIDTQNHRPRTACDCIGSSLSPRPAAATASPTVSNSGKRASPEPKDAFFGYDLSTFSKIPLPIAHPSPPLRLCISDPCTPPQDSVAVHSPADSQRIVAGSSSLPPKPPVLNRPVSDLTPSPAKNLSRSNDESPSAKRLRRMQDRLDEMNQWVEETVHEVDDSMGNEAVPEPTKVDGEAGGSQGSVRVDQVGECINIRFKCPCKKVFHVLLLGKDVFYRLI